MLQLLDGEEGRLPCRPWSYDNMTYRERFFISPIILAATMFAVVSGPAGAADLYEGDLPPTAYEDRRYEEIYEYPPPRAEARHLRYEERHYSVRERHVADRDTCLRPHEFERVLYEDGWNDIDDLEFEGRYVRVEASRIGTDREFDLVLDGCSGRILEALPEHHDHHHHHRHARHDGYRY